MPLVGRFSGSNGHLGCFLVGIWVDYSPVVVNVRSHVNEQLKTLKESVVLRKMN